RGLARFEELRIGVGRRVIERARHLGAYLQSRARSPEERLRAEKHRAPAAVMAETAGLDFFEGGEPARSAAQSGNTRLRATRFIRATNPTISSHCRRRSPPWWRRRDCSPQDDRSDRNPPCRRDSRCP